MVASRSATTTAMPTTDGTGTGAPRAISERKAAAPVIAAVAYSSPPCRIMGISVVRTSRITPPATPVSTPMTPALVAGRPSSWAIPAPLTTKNARPNASATARLSSGGGRQRTYTTVSSAAPVITAR